jgi:hypothetical protein
MPALPLDEAGKYVASAYLVFLTLVLVYIAIIGAKVQRGDKELGELADRETQRSKPGPNGNARERRHRS